MKNHDRDRDILPGPREGARPSFLDPQPGCLTDYFIIAMLAFVCVLMATIIGVAAAALWEAAVNA